MFSMRKRKLSYCLDIVLPWRESNNPCLSSPVFYLTKNSGSYISDKVAILVRQSSTFIIYCHVMLWLLIVIVHLRLLQVCLCVLSSSNCKTSIWIPPLCGTESILVCLEWSSSLTGMASLQWQGLPIYYDFDETLPAWPNVKAMCSYPVIIKYYEYSGLAHNFNTTLVKK